MKPTTLFSVLLCFLASCAWGWEKEDHEIFRLRDDVINSEGPNATFYSFIGVSPRANLDEINRAYRKKAARIHPDKAKSQFIANYGKPNKGDTKKSGAKVHKRPSPKEIQAAYKEANERFGRLGVVAGILRGPQRERYDYFVKNGFPKWRGTGYYYTRYRPGLGTVLIGLFVAMGGFAHYGAMYLGWKRQKDFVERYIRHARRMAWGDEAGIQGIPGVGGAFNSNTAPSTGFESVNSPDEPQATNWNRRERRLQEKENRKAGKNPKAAKAAKEGAISAPQAAEQTSGPRGAKKRVVAENGKVLIVDSVGNVYLEEETEDGEVHEYLLDPSEIPAPTIYDTVLFKAPRWVYAMSFGRLMGKDDGADQEEILHVPAEEEAISQATAVNQNGEARKRKLQVR